MTLRASRLAFAMQRTELLLLLGAVVVLVAASLLIAWQTSEVRAAFDACMQRLGPGASCSPSSPSLNDLSLWGSFAKLGAFLTPFALGLILGVPVVAREVEGRTAPIAWTLSRSRARWLVLRVAPLVVLVILAASLAGIASEILARTNPFADHALDPGFADYQARGVLLPVRALAVLLLAIAVGAMVPRQLPALLLAGGAALALFVAMTIGLDAWMAGEAEPIEMDQVASGGPRIFDMAYRNDATGEVISMNAYYNRYGDVQTPDGEQPEGFSEVALGIPSDQYGLWVLRETAILGALALTSTAGALVVVNRRRPS